MEHDFISFIDENGEKQDNAVEIISIEEGFVTFKTLAGNTIIIPSFKILKIKLKNKESENNDDDKTSR